MHQMKNRFMKMIQFWFIEKKTIQYSLGILAVLMWIGCALTYKQWYVDTMFRLLGLAFLGYGAVQDLFECEIYATTWIFLFIFQTVSFFTKGQNGMIELLLTVSFAIILMALYGMMKRHIGFADIMILISLSFGFGIHTTVTALLMASLFVLVVGAFMAVAKKIDVRKGLPMIPMIYMAMFLLHVFGKIN